MAVRGCVFCILILVYVSMAENELGKQYEYEFGSEKVAVVGSGTGDEFYNKEGSLTDPETEVFIPVPTTIKDTYVKVSVTSKDAPKVNTMFGAPLITLTIAFDRNQLPGGFYNITAKGIKEKEVDSAVTTNRAETQNSTEAAAAVKEAGAVNESAAANNNTTAAPQPGNNKL